MQIEKYTTRADTDRLKYRFISIGKKAIEKVVAYEKFPTFKVIELGFPPYIEVYNLAFGDLIPDTDDFSDQITSDNGDMNKILSTVANTVLDFWEYNSDAFIWFEGSQPENQEGIRTYLYQKKLERFFAEINEVANVLGRAGTQLELFEKGKKYNAFLIIRKR